MSLFTKILYLEMLNNSPNIWLAKTNYIVKMSFQNKLKFAKFRYGLVARNARGY